jgi:hypothetical protein
MLNHEENQGFTGLGSDVVAIDPYGIPITFFCIPSRIPMQRVTPSGAGKAAFDCALDLDQDRTPPSGFCRPTGTLLLGAYL